MNTLDSTDFAILALLQEDASQSIQQIADCVHLSQNACWRRIRQMEESGVIKKRVALLDAAKVGAGLTVFVQVRAAEHSEAWLENFAAAVKRIPEIVEGSLGRTSAAPIRTRRRYLPRHRQPASKTPRRGIRTSIHGPGWESPGGRHLPEVPGGETGESPLPPEENTRGRGRDR